MKLGGQYKKFYENVTEVVEQKRMFTSPVYTLAYGTDASFYRLVPKIVIWAQNANEIECIIKNADLLDISVVFRAAGTSLSGQAITDSVLVVTYRDWDDITIAKDNASITLAPSVIGSKANAALTPFSKKIGPDPASINSAMIGGIVANNASGMCCGTSDNSYKTIQDMKIIFADGSRLDTADKRSKEEFAKTHKAFLDSIRALSQKIKSSSKLKSQIERKFSIKNTCGYGLNSLVDFDEPFEIIKHLMVGSEGTLGFIEEVTLKTIPDYPDKASALMIFSSMKDACEAVAKLKLTCKDEVDAAELMDRASLRSVEDKEAMPSYLKSLSDDATALLVESRGASEDILEANIETIVNAMSSFTLEIPLEFTKDAQKYQTYWNIRKGLFPAVGSVREAGSTVIIEDVAYPIEYFSKGIEDLRKLLKRHGFDKAIIFGHALDGNVHFVITQKFEAKEERDRYEAFMDELSKHVASDYKGSLKAEHGTGRNMAPFVPLEWGEEAYELMKEIKRIFDPKELLNPGVIINKDPKAHLKNLKILPKTNPQVDMCIECGFCEDTCPSNVLSFTPRQRIVINREISRLKKEHQDADAVALKAAYAYPGLETCAACSLCFLKCPVSIDMGKMTKWLRGQEHGTLSNSVATGITNSYKLLLNGASGALKGVHFLSHINPKFSNKIAKGVRKIAPIVPLWSESLPSNTKVLQEGSYNAGQAKKVVYFSSCINQTFGNPKPKDGEKTLHESVLSIFKKANFEVIVPTGSRELCCGLPFLSKGFKAQGLKKQSELYEALKIASDGGKYPIVCDMSPCTKTLLENLPAELTVYEVSDFIYKEARERLDFYKTDERVVLHVTCSTQNMKTDSSLVALAKLCSDEVVVPKDITCCGFSGDRGFTYPELNKSALRKLNEGIPKGTKLAFSTSKTCEIGLSEVSGLTYRSIVYLVDRCTECKVG